MLSGSGTTARWVSRLSRPEVASRSRRTTRRSSGACLATPSRRAASTSSSRRTRSPERSRASHSIRTCARRRRGTPGGAAALARIVQLLHRTTGVDFSHYKANTLYRRIARRVILHRLAGLPEYVQFLERQPRRTGRAAPGHPHRRHQFLPGPRSVRGAGDHCPPTPAREPAAATSPLRIWVLGCSTGEEAYSLAMAADGGGGSHGRPAPAQVFATDLSAPASRRRGPACIRRPSRRMSPPERLRRFFVEIDGSYRVTQGHPRPLRLRPAQRADRSALFPRRSDQLPEPAHLPRASRSATRPVGAALRAQAAGSALARRLGDDRVHIRTCSRQRTRGTRSLRSDRGALGRPSPAPPIWRCRLPRPKSDVAVSPSIVRGRPIAGSPQGCRARLGRTVCPARRAGLRRHGDPSAVGRHRSLPDTGTGQGELESPQDAPRGLLASVREAVLRARTMRRPVRPEGLRVELHGGSPEVTVEVIPIDPVMPLTPTGPVLILFENTSPVGPAARRAPGPANATATGGAAPGDRSLDTEVARLAQELAATREYLQAVIEQQEAANEELQSANEEVQSANEELQSINEELETSKEEIQSSNEELATVNDELNHRNLELGRTNNDLTNLLGESPDGHRHPRARSPDPAVHAPGRDGMFSLRRRTSADHSGTSGSACRPRSRGHAAGRNRYHQDAGARGSGRVRGAGTYCGSVHTGRSITG